MNSLKKFLSSFVTLMTIAWSMGGAMLAPSMAQAATLSPGDLIKASGPAVYYYAADGKRYVFPNEKTFFSWYTGFSSVVTITDGELAAITIGGNVTIRPGTKLVKITTDPKTYAVTGACATLHWIQTEAVATALYGSSWNTRIVDVPDAFFVDYQVGSAVTTNVHPDGQIISYASDASTFYVLDGGVKRKLTSAGISANKLNTANAIVTTITYANGSDVTGYEDGLGKVNCGTGTVAVKGNVTVALASDTPAGKTVPYNAASIELAKFNLSADSNDAVVTGISLKRIGVGSVSDFKNVYLYDANGNRLTSGHSINSSTNVATFNGLNLMIPANSTKSIVVVGDLSSPSVTSGQHAFQIADAASVVISGTGTVGGSFPMTGNTFTVGSTKAGTVTVEVGTDPSDPAIGSTAAEIANFKLTASTDDIQINRIALTVDSGGADVSNFKLSQASNVVGTASALTNGLAVITLNPAFVIAKGTTKTFSLTATVGGRSSNTIKVYLDNSSDIQAIDTQYNSGAAVSISSSDVPAGKYDGTTVSSTDYFNSVVTKGGQLTIAQNGPATGNITKGGTDVALYDFALTSSDSALDFRKLRMNVTCTAGTDGSSCGQYLSNLKITGTGVALGPKDTFTTSTDLIFTDTFSLDAGKTVNLKVTGNIQNASGAANATYKVTLSPFQDGDIKISSTNQNLSVANDVVPNAGIVGNTFTVKASSLTAALASTPASATVVKKQADVATAGFVFTAGDQMGATISKIILQGSATSSATSTATFKRAYFRNIVSSCGLYDGDTLLKTANADTNGLLTYTSLGISIAKNVSKTLVAKCTTLSTITGMPSFAVGLNSVTAQDEQSNEISIDVTQNDADNNLSTETAAPVIYQTLANNGTGTLTIATGSEPESTIILGATETKLAEFRASAINEDIKITKITVTSTGDAAALTAVNVRVKGSTDIVGSGVLTAGQMSTKTITLTTPVTIVKDGTQTIELWGQVGTIVKPSNSSGPRSGITIGLGFDALNSEAFGLSSGEKLTITDTNTGAAEVSGNSMVLRKSKPTVTVQSVNTTLSSGVQKDLIKFQVSADAAGDVAWKKINFTISTTTHVTGLTGFKLYRGTSDITTDAVGTSTFNGTTLTIFLKDGKEEVVSGSGQQYTISATPVLASPASGDSITTKIAEDSGTIANVVTGNYSTLDSSNFVWTDLSEPGSPLSTNVDWTSGLFLKDLTTQTALVY